MHGAKHVARTTIEPRNCRMRTPSRDPQGTKAGVVVKVAATP